jgi:N-acetylmuramic acid 6-phosphate etherase
MVKMGRVYGGLMVHMRASNAKLRRRAEGMVRQIVDCSAEDAARFVAQADGDVKIAVLLGFGLQADRTAALLQKHDGNLRLAIDSIKRGHA